jgi:hypothetical protein
MSSDLATAVEERSISRSWRFKKVVAPNANQPQARHILECFAPT